jgi:hypothetical protein
MSERQALEALQRRASLNNPRDRDALLTNPGAIDYRPIKSPLGTCSSRSGMAPSSDFPPCCLVKVQRWTSTDCLSSHTSGGTALDGCWSNTPLFSLARKGRPPCTWSGIRTQRSFTGRAVSRCSERSLPVLASACHSEECCNHQSHRSEGAESRLSTSTFAHPLRPQLLQGPQGQSQPRLCGTERGRHPVHIRKHSNVRAYDFIRNGTSWRRMSK